MHIEDVIATLGYDESPNFLTPKTGLDTVQAFGHIFRVAQGKPGLAGVYTLRPDDTAGSPIVPVVYVCHAQTEADADEAHRLVWNQDVVPFALINTPKSVRLYSGFRYDKRKSGPASGLLREFHGKDELASLGEGFSAVAIDEGRLWRQWGEEVRREDRVDWQLLENLKRLDKWLCQGEGLDLPVSHALIGKYVYLHYLKDRGILSDRKLATWDITRESVFGRNATLSGLRSVVKRLDEWLNGGVFPLKLSGKDAPGERQLQRVAATFFGDQPLDDGAWQLHLDFQAYDFSYIPIETLSVVYEQFLHAPIKSTDSGGEETDGPDEREQSRGRQAGAYYTPIPVVNFMLAELDDRRPLEEGMTVFDPSCGSGAFLVQCYRQLIERTFRSRQQGQKPTPSALRELLVKHIFGVDRDPDACRVTELSLVLTLLDYVDPPDLENYKNFKLPSLRDVNIFCSDLFDARLQESSLATKRFDWIVGNPPWKKLNPAKFKLEDKPAWQRMEALQANGRPVGSHQLAQVFMWEVERYLAPKGQAALLIPAMTFFEDPSSSHRAKLFENYRVHAVANFANLAEVLFAGRSRVPAAAIFFRLRGKGEAPSDTETVSAYSPLVANQESTRPVVAGRRNKTWSLVLNASEVREIPVAQVMTGDGLPWKLAVWGSEHDLRLLSKLRKRFDSLLSLEEKGLLIVSQGPELRTESSEGRREFEQDKSLVGKLVLDTKKLAGLRHFFVFPEDAFSKNIGSYLRSGLKEGLEVCTPPHIIVSAARNFAIFSDEFLLVPPRQIGISSPTKDAGFLKAISLFLSSDVAYYHQFFTSTELGIKRDRATLASLRELPIPVNAIVHNQKSWTDLHGRLVRASRQALKHVTAEETPLFDLDATTLPPDLQGLLHELNSLAAGALGLDSRDAALIEDLVSVRLLLNDGKLGRPAVEPPKAQDLKRYAKRLKDELDSFVGDELNRHHEVQILHDSHSAMVKVDFVDSRSGGNQVVVIQAARNESVALAKARDSIRREHSQWVYFDRNLRIFEGRCTYFLKPMQRFQWTESQAMSDASGIISATVGQGEMA